MVTHQLRLVKDKQKNLFFESFSLESFSSESSFMHAQVIEIPYFFIFLQRVDRLMERACAVLVISMSFLPRASRISLRSFSCLESDFERVTFSKGACQDLRLVLSEESINVVSSTFHFFHPDFRPESYRPNRISHRILLKGNTEFKLRAPPGQRTKACMTLTGPPSARSRNSPAQAGTIKVSA